MLSKLCPNCGKKIGIGKVCGCRKNDRVGTLSKYSAEIKRFYTTNEWEKARNICISKCFGLDLISLFLEKKIEYGFTVHHIVPLINDYSKRLLQSNLIYLTESHHRLVHMLYDADYQTTVEALKNFSDTAREALAYPGGISETFDLLKDDRCGSFLFEKL
jgi:hypothetical protein